MRRREFIAGLGAAGWPLMAKAQKGARIRRIGVLMAGDENDPVRKTLVSAFTQALAGLGWIDSRNVRMDLRWAGGDSNRIRALAQELVGLQPDIILAPGTAATVAVQRETRTIPIVFLNSGDPVASGISARSECLSFASAVWAVHPGSHPKWRLRLPGHIGEKCWYAENATNLLEPEVQERRAQESPRTTESDPRPVGHTKRVSSEARTRTIDQPNETVRSASQGTWPPPAAWADFDSDLGQTDGSRCGVGGNLREAGASCRVTNTIGTLPVCPCFGYKVRVRSICVKKPEPTKPTTWTIYKSAAKQTRLGTVEAPDEAAVIQKGCR